MKEQTIYICEICGGAYSSKETAESCEKLGLPEDFNKNIGKWYFAPVQIFLSEDYKDSSIVISKVDWRLIRIDEGKLVGNKNIKIREVLKLETLSHKIEYTIKTFEDGSMLVNDLFNQKIEVDPKFHNILNKSLVNMEMNRPNRRDFIEWQHNDSINILNNICRSQSIELPKIIGIEKYNYSNEVEKNG